MSKQARKFYDDRDMLHDPVSHGLFIAVVACIGGIAWCLVALAGVS